MLHRCSGDVHELELVGERRHHPTPDVELATEDHFTDRRLRELEAPRLEVRHGRHRERLDRHAGHALEVLEHAVLTRLSECDRHAGAARTAGAANAVHVRLGGARHVVVHHMRHMRDVEAAGRDVGRDQQFGRVCAEPLHHAVALLLRESAMQRLGVEAATVHRLGEFIDLGARTAKDDRGLRLFHVKDAAQCRHLVRARHEVRHLAHLGTVAGVHRGRVDPDHMGIAQVRLGDRRDARRERG